MSLTHNYSVIAGIMSAMTGGAGGPQQGEPNIISVVGPSAVNEGTGAPITVTTENFPDGDTTLDWAITQNAGDFVVSSGDVIIKKGTVTTVYQEVDGATVDIQPETGVYNYTFGGTLSGSGIGYGYPLVLNQRIGSTNYFRGSEVSTDRYRVTEKITSGGDGTATFNVTPELDGVSESDESFTVTVSGTVNGGSVTRTSSPITIRNINTTTNIPAGTFVARPASSNNYAAQHRNDVVSQAGETVTAVAYLLTTISKTTNVVDGNGVRFTISVASNDEWRGDARGTNVRTWWTTNNDPQPFPRATPSVPIPSPVILYENTNAIPTAVRIVYRLEGTTGGDVDLGWQTTPNLGDGDSASFQRIAQAGAGSDDFESGTIEVDFYGRADGYSDTLLATFWFRLEAYADGASF